MKTNDLKKGDWIILRELNWRGEMWDNMRGNTRVVDVYGWEHEAGSVYSHDILHKIVSLTGKTLPIDILKNVNITTDEIMKNNELELEAIEHTDKQKKLREMICTFAKEEQYG